MLHASAEYHSIRGQHTSKRAGYQHHQQGLVSTQPIPSVGWVSSSAIVFDSAPHALERRSRFESMASETAGARARMKAVHIVQASHGHDVHTRAKASGDVLCPLCTGSAPCFSLPACLHVGADRPRGCMSVRSQDNLYPIISLSRSDCAFGNAAWNRPYWSERVGCPHQPACGYVQCAESDRQCPAVFPCATINNTIPSVRN